MSWQISRRCNEKLMSFGRNLTISLLRKYVELLIPFRGMFCKRMTMRLAFAVKSLDQVP